MNVYLQLRCRETSGTVTSNIARSSALRHSAELYITSVKAIPLPLLAQFQWKTAATAGSAIQGTYSLNFQDDITLI